MEDMKVEFDKADRTLTIVCKVPKKLSQSKSGKSRIVYSSGGNQKTGIKVEGQEVIIGLNAYIKDE